MPPRTFFRWSVALSLGGTLFAGYLSAVKLITKVCAFGETCPLFLGYPSCWFGFGMFAALLILSALGLARRMGERSAAKGIVAVASLGTLFAGRYAVQEISGWFATGTVTLYGFGLPTCVYGLIFFLALLILSARFLAKPSVTTV